LLLSVKPIGLNLKLIVPREMCYASYIPDVTDVTLKHIIYE